MAEREIVDYFIKATTSKFNRLDDRMDEMEKRIHAKIDELQRFKFTWTGGLVMFNAMITVILTVATIYYLRTQ